MTMDSSTSETTLPEAITDPSTSETALPEAITDASTSETAFPDDITDILYLEVDSVTFELQKCTRSDRSTCAIVVTEELPKIVKEPWFQDTTALFGILLNDTKSFVMCTFPPGSGKSTTCELLKYYLLPRDEAPADICSFLDGCAFQREESKNVDTATRFRGCASYVVHVDFINVQGSCKTRLMSSYSALMMSCWRSLNLPQHLIDREQKLLDAGLVWDSLSRLRYRLAAEAGSKGLTYFILDSVDNMYNLIANLPPKDRFSTFKCFGDGIRVVIDKWRRTHQTFCFGVSPYLVHEFVGTISTRYHIGLKNNEVSKYFSYWDITISNMIKELKLPVSLEQCKAVARFQYNSNEFVNPYLCVSYLKSVKENGAPFKVRLSPRSLWMKCIFTEDDLRILHKALLGPAEYRFDMSVSMNAMCTDNDKIIPRSNFYPLFVYGGFLSCIPIYDADQKNCSYRIWPSNKSSEIILRHHLDHLFF